MLESPRRRGRGKVPPFSVLGLALAVASCRFSGSATDPYAEAPLGSSQGGAAGRNTGGNDDTGGNDATGGSDGAGGSDGSGGTGNTGGSGDAAGSGNIGGSGAAGAGTSSGGSGTDSGATGDTGAGGTGGSEGGMPPTPGDCTPPATPPAICDPVKNLGCLVPFTFCDIDPMQVVATGRCVFPWSATPPPDAATCVVDMTTDSCAPTSTCVGGSCRKLCYCDSDCPGGNCCSEPAPGSSTAFKLCKPC